ncbi:MAG: hypothetical protein IPF42_07410 [Candidatus Microthrix sp.]|nr:hypothetical protein [Candidatus Microthrix sp.]
MTSLVVSGDVAFEWLEFGIPRQHGLEGSSVRLHDRLSRLGIGFRFVTSSDIVTVG